MDRPEEIDLSFVIIAYNEARTLSACIRSVRQADLEGLRYEVIYVDGGSKDESPAIAREAGVDRLLGGEKQRRAAENRNLGWRATRGRFVQFLDGDMAMRADWPRAAHRALEASAARAAVTGGLREANQSLIFRALQLDWALVEGEVRHCGGAAMWRRETLEAMDGFPEDMRYGEEPYLCWRVRNELGMHIYNLAQAMADHDLGFRGFADYWQRAVRCGWTYCEVARRCLHSHDKLWLREAGMVLAWSAFYFVVGALLVAAPVPTGLAGLGLVALVILRKTIQGLAKGRSLDVALVYALHVYLSKIPTALGEIKYLLAWAAGKEGRGRS